MNGTVYLIVTNATEDGTNLILGMAATRTEAETVLSKIKLRRSKFIYGPLLKKDIFIQQTSIRNGIIPELFEEVKHYQTSEDHAVINFG
jgi:uncharacterized circularly permuted ATP-grasp superfamily protein